VVLGHEVNVRFSQKNPAPEGAGFLHLYSLSYLVVLITPISHDEKIP